jgi:hypothetical protein
MRAAAPARSGSELFSAGSIELKRWREGRLEKQPALLEDLLTRQRLPDWALDGLKDLTAEQARLAVRLLAAFAVENGFLDLGETLEAKARAVQQVEPVLAKLSRDQVIIRAPGGNPADRASRILGQAHQRAGSACCADRPGRCPFWSARSPRANSLWRCSS